MPRTAVAAIAWFLLSAGGLRAQDQLRPLPAGERARIYAGRATIEPVVGRVVASDSAGVSLVFGRAAAMLWLPVSQIRMIELSEGHPRLSWGVMGAGVGLVGGMLLGAAIGQAVEPSGWGVLIGIELGVLLGPIAGGVVGAVVAPEQWEIWPLPRGDAAAAPPTSRARITLPSGVDVRLEGVGGGRVRGTVAGQDTGSLTIRARGERVTSTHRWSELRQLEIRGGRDRKRGAAIGALVLGGIAVVFGGIDATQGEMSGGELAETIVGNSVIGAGLGWVFAPAGWVGVPQLRE